MRRALARRGKRPFAQRSPGLDAGTLSDCVGNTKTVPGRRQMRKFTAAGADE